MSETSRAATDHNFQSTAAIAREWGCHKRTILREIRGGNLRGFKLAGRWVVLTSDKRDYLQRQIDRQWT